LFVALSPFLLLHTMSVAAFEELGVMPELIEAAADLGWRYVGEGGCLVLGAGSQQQRRLDGEGEAPPPDRPALSLSHFFFSFSLL